MIEKLIKWFLVAQSAIGVTFSVYRHYHDIPITTEEHLISLAVTTPTLLVYLWIRNKNSKSK